MATELYKVENDTNQVFVIYEVGRFVPGETELELTDEQVQLMKDNAILKTSKVSKTQKVAAKSEETPSEEVIASDENQEQTA